MEVTFGFVQSLGPTTVRFAGDTTDVPVALKNAGVTLVVGNKVALVKAGTSSGWVIAFVIGATP